MIPQNEPVLQRQTSARELSWMDRIQLKVDSLYDNETAKSPKHIMQETSAYLEKQITVAGTTVRHFCADFAKEFLLPESTEKVEATQVDASQAQSNGLSAGTGKVTKSEKSAKLVNSPVFNPEGSISGSSLEEKPIDQVTAAQELAEPTQAVLTPVVEVSTQSPCDVTSTPPKVSERSVQQTVAKEEEDSFAHWLVSEEDRKMCLGKSTSASSLQSCGSLQREPSNDSLHDWELV